ncbi:hypothetical protein FRC00_009430 [Tulasnella sp. 408]|nr:hypothetical protein FRC00_009430 [Tulasnella sp. 408]
MYDPRTRGNPNASRAHGPRSAVLGSGPHSVPPAWRHGNPQPRTGGNPQNNEGNKILISGLPFDVEKEAIVELFQSTVGPLEEVTCVYTKEARPTGMSIVQFKKAQDAHEARKMYNGKVVDQRKPIKVEIIGEPLPSFGLMNPNQSAQAPAPQMSLIERLGMTGSTFMQSQQGRKGRKPNVMQLQQQNAWAVQQQAHAQSNPGIVALDGERRPRKKGPKRIQKARAMHFVPKKKSAAQLDAEMDDYRSSAPKPPPSSP